MTIFSIIQHIIAKLAQPILWRLPLIRFIKNAYLALGRKLNEKATHLFEHKEYTQARIAYTGAIQFDPACEHMYQAQITSLIEMGRTLHKQRKYQEALDLYEGAIQFHPGNAFTYAEKGHSLYALHHYSDALMAYTQAMALDPNYKGVFAHKEAPLITQGEAFYEHGDYQQALTIYEQVLQFNPENKYAQTAKMKIFYKLEQIAEEKRIAEHMKKLTTNKSSWLCEKPFRYE